MVAPCSSTWGGLEAACKQTGQGRVPLERGCSARATVTHGCALVLHSLSATVCGPSKVKPIAFRECPQRVRTSRLDSSQGIVNCSPSLFPSRDCPLLASSIFRLGSRHVQRVRTDSRQEAGIVPREPGSSFSTP